MEKLKKIVKVGILPWAGKDEHQLNFAKALEDRGYSVVRITYKKGFPLHNALKNDIDLLILDWVHSFYISSSSWVSLTKTILQYGDRQLVKKRTIPIVWNMHNLHRHDKKFLKLEQFNFKKLAACVDGIRVFNNFSIKEVRKYLNLKDNYPIINIPQGQYKEGQEFQTGKYAGGKLITDEINLLFFGSIRAGKGLDKFLSAFRKLKSQDIKLTIAGTPMDDDLIRFVRAQRDADTRITLIDRFITDAELANLFNKAFALVLPYENILNSGVQLLAHSFSKPLLASDHPVFLNNLSEKYTEFFSLSEPGSLDNALNKLRVRNYPAMQIASASVLNDHKWESVVKQMIEFGELLACKRAGFNQ